MLRDKIKEVFKEAMKTKNSAVLSTMRLIMAALKDRDIAVRAEGNSDGIGEDQILSMLQSMIKQRRDSIEMYEKGGRLELAEQERNEIKVIEQFLPQQMNEAKIGEVISALIEELEATGLKDMGRTMAALRERYAGQMDFSKASAIIKAKLS